MINKDGVAIQYGDIAPEAKESFIVLVSEKEPFVDLSQFQEYNVDFPQFENPCELYSVVLNGGGVPFPEYPENESMGFWSEQLSDENGNFNTPIVFTLTSEGQYSSQGLTFTFDIENNIHPKHINIHWWRDTGESLTDLGEMDFYPDNAVYFCQNKVSNYNRIVISIDSLNLPYNRLKFRAIDYGYGTVFYGDELRNVRISQTIDPISSEININSSNFTLDSKSNIVYSFQSKQPISIFFNRGLRVTAFIKKSSRKGEKLWDVQCEDYIGILDKTNYYGGMYNGKDAYELLTDIFAVAKVPCNIDESIKGINLYGYIPYTTCREALMQVLFAVQRIVDTSNSDKVNVFKLNDEISQTIPLDRIMQGQSFSDEETVTSVELTVHSYKTTDEEIEAYKAVDSGIGQNIFVKFTEPLYDLSITNGEFVTDDNGVELKNANYAVINAEEGCIVKGKKYEHTTSVLRKNNPVILASETENIVTITDATLVSSYNAQGLLDICYDWLSKTNSTNLKIVEGKQVSGGEYYLYGQEKYGTIKYGSKSPKVTTYDKVVNIGDIISSETQYLGTVTGRIIKQNYSLNGGIIIKEAVLK